MFNLFMWIDPVTPVLESKELGLAIISVVLFVGSTVYNLLINNKLQDIKQSQDDLRKQLDNVSDLMLAEVEKVADVLKDNSNILEAISTESHEQWSFLSKTNQQVNENAIRLYDISGMIKDIAQQQTILATTSLNQAAQHEKVVSGLLDVLQDHTRD